MELTEATRALAKGVDRDAMAAVVVQAVAGDLWAPHMADPAFREALHTSVRDNVGTILALFAGETTLADIRPPAEFRLTDMLAEMGVGVGELERSYWVGMSRLWAEWFALAQTAADDGRGTVGEFVGPPTELMFQYLIEVLAIVVDRYDAVGEQIRLGRDDQRRTLVAALVDGTSTASVAEAEQVLGYRLGGMHLGLVLHVSGRREAERATDALRAAVGARGSLLTLHGPGAWLAWLALPAGRPVVDPTPAAGVPISAGEPADGLSGFLQTRSDALEIAGLRRWFGGEPGVLRFCDVRLELLLLKDPVAAARFVADELGELAGDGERAERARDTLLDWLVTGSTTQTAARLSVHENTVRLRIAQAEELLPGDLRGRRAEVLAALRLRAVVANPQHPR
ncbi:MAG: PucR family transcriptional regulator [Sporichthyaceae bacterium]